MASCSISSPATTWARTMWSCFGPSTRCGPNSSQVSGRAVLTRSVVRLEDALADPDYDHRFPAAMGWRRMLGVPMLRQGEPLGVIVVGWAEAGPVPKAQEELLKQFADQAVIAIENVRLFDEVQARTRELTRSVARAAGAQRGQPGGQLDPRAAGGAARASPPMPWRSPGRMPACSAPTTRVPRSFTSRRPTSWTRRSVEALTRRPVRLGEGATGLAGLRAPRGPDRGHRPGARLPALRRRPQARLSRAACGAAAARGQPGRRARALP